MSRIPTIRTDRLCLRPLTENDFEAEADFLLSDRARFVGGPMGHNEARQKFTQILDHWQLRGFGFWAVDELATGKYCGRVGLWYPDDWPEPEIGWALIGEAEGRGFAFEAAQRSRTYAYQTLGWRTAISLIDPANERSIALATRLGAVPEYEYDHPTLGRMMAWRHPGP